MLVFLMNLEVGRSSRNSDSVGAGSSEVAIQEPVINVQSKPSDHAAAAATTVEGFPYRMVSTNDQFPSIEVPGVVCYSPLKSPVSCQEMLEMDEAEFGVYLDDMSTRVVQLGGVGSSGFEKTSFFGDIAPSDPEELDSGMNKIIVDNKKCELQEVISCLN